MPDPLSAAVERLRASVDALGDMGPERWETNHEFVVMRDDGEEWEVADCDTSATGRRDAIAEHIALTASPPTVRLLANLLEAVHRLWESDLVGPGVGDVLSTARALASHLTEGSTTA